MCDETTELENTAYLETRRLNRRELGLGAGAAALGSLLVGCDKNGQSTDGSNTPDSSPPPNANGPGSGEQTPDATVDTTTSRLVELETADGTADAFFVTPKDGKHPGVLMWPDVAGVRPGFEQMATRLAAEGYAVLLVNCYYRSSKLPILKSFDEWTTAAGKAKISPMREQLTAEAIARDGASFVAWLDRQPEVDTARKLTTTGYCMSGPFTFRTAAAAPERVGVIGSFHGGGLVTEDATSPHTLFASMKAAALICIAQNDDQRQPDAKDTLREAARQANVRAEIEVYPAQHGWCAIDSPVYDQEQAEKAWARLLSTIKANV